MKKIFSNVWFKCISVLLIIALLSGGILALLNDLLYVSPDERSMRAIKKIYGEEKEFSILLDVDSDDENLNKAITYEEFGNINKIYKVGEQENYDLLFCTVGTGGYKNGTITVWVKVVCSGETEKIETVIMESFTKQTLMSKLDGSFYNNFYVDITDDYFVVKSEQDGTYNPVSGATYSATAANNAVNCVIKYIRGTKA